MEKTLQEKAEHYINNSKIDTSNRFIRKDLLEVFIDGYNLHTQESKTLDDKYKKVVMALNRFIEITKQEGFEYQDNRWLAYKQAESVLKDLEQDKL